MPDEGVYSVYEDATMLDKRELVTKIRVKVNPGAPKNQFLGTDGDVYRIKLAAQPIKGKANKELKEYLARLLGVRKGDVQIVSGEHSRTKTVKIKGITKEELVRILGA